METKRELLSKLLDAQLSLVGCLNAGRVGYSATPSDSNRLLNAILGVEALTNAIAALPLTPEDQGQVVHGTLHKVGQNEEWFTGYQALPSIGDEAG